MLTRLIHWIVSNPAIYDFVQFIVGGNIIRKKLSHFLTEAEDYSLLDIGGGTGRIIPIIPNSVKYFCLDNDLIKLRSLRKKYPGIPIVMGDAANLPFYNGAINNTLFAFVSHHLSDSLFIIALKEVARVCDGRLIFLDGLKVSERVISKFLWRLDRGRFPRSEQTLVEEIEKKFLLQNVAYISIFHQYIIIVANKRNIQ